jgi:hypothetical protein
MVDHRLFAPAPGRCWDCGSPSLHAVSDGYDTDLVCESCCSAWHIELGQVVRVRDVSPPSIHDPATLPRR